MHFLTLPKPLIVWRLEENWRCNSTNQVWLHSRPDLPTVSVSSRPVVVVEGEDVTLVCNTTGRPAPSVEWTKSGVVLSSTSNLLLCNVQRPENAENIIRYQCTAKNGIGTANASVQVAVYCEYETLPVSDRCWIFISLIASRFNLLGEVLLLLGQSVYECLFPGYSGPYTCPTFTDSSESKYLW